MKIGEHITVGDQVFAGLIMNIGLTESLAAPSFTFDMECIGPGDANREQYLALLADAEEASRKGNIVASKEIEKAAKKMLSVQWKETFHNLVTNEGRNDILTKYFKGSSYTAAWYLGLKGTGSAAAGDTLASHAGWSEVTPYSGNRPAITWGTASSQSLAASSAVSYSITGTSTVAGAFISSVNTGTSGILYSAGDFGASRSVASGDTLNVTPTVTS